MFFSWSKEAEELRQIAIRSPWLIDSNFISNHFKTLRIVDKGVSLLCVLHALFCSYVLSAAQRDGSVFQVQEIDEHVLKFRHLEELSLSANKLHSINSRNLPRSLKVLEVCANEITSLEDLCAQPPPLLHLGVGYNRLTTVSSHITGHYWFVFSVPSGNQPRVSPTLKSPCDCKYTSTFQAATFVS